MLSWVLFWCCYDQWRGTNYQHAVHVPTMYHIAGKFGELVLSRFWQNLNLAIWIPSAIGAHAIIYIGNLYRIRQITKLKTSPSFPLYSILLCLCEPAIMFLCASPLIPITHHCSHVCFVFVSSSPDHHFSPTIVYLTIRNYLCLHACCVSLAVEPSTVHRGFLAQLGMSMLNLRLFSTVLLLKIRPF